MAFSPGHKAWLMLDGANGGGTNISTYADQVSFPQSVEMLEVTTFGSAVKRFIAGLAGGDTVPLSGPLDSALHLQIGSMLSAQAAGTASFTLINAPMGSASGLPRQTVEVLVANYTTNAGVGGRGEFSASLQVDGAVTNATW